MNWIIKMGVTIWALGHIIGAVITVLLFVMAGLFLVYLWFDNWRMDRKRRKAGEEPYLPRRNL